MRPGRFRFGWAMARLPRECRAVARVRRRRPLQPQRVRVGIVPGPPSSPFGSSSTAASRSSLSTTDRSSPAFDSAHTCASWRAIVAGTDAPYAAYE